MKQKNIPFRIQKLKMKKSLIAPQFHRILRKNGSVEIVKKDIVLSVKFETQKLYFANKTQQIFRLLIQQFIFKKF